MICFPFTHASATCDLVSDTPHPILSRSTSAIPQWRRHSPSLISPVPILYQQPSSITCTNPYSHILKFLTSSESEVHNLAYHYLIAKLRLNQSVKMSPATWLQRNVTEKWIHCINRSFPDILGNAQTTSLVWKPNSWLNENYDDIVNDIIMTTSNNNNLSVSFLAHEKTATHPPQRNKAQQPPHPPHIFVQTKKWSTIKHSSLKHSSMNSQSIHIT